MTIQTKIICTIGPSCCSYENIVELINAGMNVARLNFSHGTYDQHVETIDLLKKARENLKVPLAIMLDTCGPEVRVGKIEGDEIFLVRGEKCFLVSENVIGNFNKIPVNPAHVLKNLPKGTQILFDDGYISTKILEHTPEGVMVEVEDGGRLKSKKGVNIPNVSLDLPAVTEKDVEDIKFGCSHDVDIIAASFVRAAENIITVKNILSEMKCEHILVAAKIENHEGVQNFDKILQVADGIMIARGDLGVEVPLSMVPRLQKEMIRKCYLSGKPSITATQMLESMIYNPRPTRAEVSDVANAIYDSTSAVMLSGETAIGKYPVNTLLVMKSVIKEAEADFDYKTFLNLHSSFIYKDVPSSVTFAAAKTAYSSNARAIFAFTSGGATARLLSRLRPPIPIIAMTTNKRTYHQMALNWGVIPVLSEGLLNLKEAFLKLTEYALENKLVSYGDSVIVIAGSTFGISGTTNMMIVETIGDVLVRGERGVGSRVYGNVKFLHSSTEGTDPYSVRGQLLVLSHCNETFLPYIHAAAGVILQNNYEDRFSEDFLLEQAHRQQKPAIVRADNAFFILKEGQLVTLDPEKSLVYKGVMLNGH